jgi:hypothetical protein
LGNLKFSSFEYLPNINRSDDAFLSSLRKIASTDTQNGIYEIDVPESLRDFVVTYSTIRNPMIVFLPDLKGFSDLDTNPRFCPGGIAVQADASANKRIDFSTVVRCLAEPSTQVEPSLR